MVERWVEIEVRATEKDGSTETVYGEYSTEAPTVRDAAREIVDHAIKARGNSRVREIEPNR
jgi:hypothetical protein